MPDIAAVLKAEIARIARKEVKTEVEPLHKAVAAQRQEILALKRRLKDAESRLRKASGRTVHGPSNPEPQSETSEAGFRFSAKGLASNRQRLGLSAEDAGLLIGVSGQSIYAWEAGKARPREGKLAAIAALRRVGKREVAERLATLKS